MGRRWGVCALLGLILACGGGDGGGGGTPAPGPAVTHAVVPSATDPAIATYLDPHVAITPDPAVPAKQRLFVFLPGTGGKPMNQQLILQAGSRQGYHAIGLMYPNTPSVGSLCNDSADAHAHWDARREIITGQDLSTLVDIPPAECIEHRLTALLSHLATTYPAEQWGPFLVSGAPDWSRIVIAGHSQGGGHAGVIAKLHPVARAVCLSSPADWRNPVDLPASWYATAGATPASQVFGFSHLQDELVTWPLVTANWAALGLGAFGGPASVDGAAAPFGGSHQLSTNLAHAPVSGGHLAPFHGATVVDAVTPRLADGSPAYRSAWVHLCFP